ncbi:Tfp pilus assembly protein FimT/FimU [Sulfuricurvum sp.]|uniref:pilus assembly FimT family protein n=1 Tax=Sulfuricurvum sp. TaxID=2025608 RepID=UPI00260C3D0F|nr:prepilin-type N-terminal cleavage/methylation domain-containing protein [Sulfuricurvum sp.]MDD2782489.1 prepilin-type N-terminal cleavage/methylation domain-containing protein [Sulfuricurvum sp.]
MKRFAFTLLELVFVIIVIGILAVLAMPSFNSNPLQQAAEQVANHIRYTQHLAMVDDKYDPNDPTWWQKRWQIQFENDAFDLGQKIYVIYSNEDKDTNEDDDETAIDPLTKQLMRGANSEVMSAPYKYMDNLMISREFGISNVTFSNSCNPSSATSNRIGFDNLGRPYTRTSTTTPFANILTDDCNITLIHTDGNATLTVAPETGYVSISYKK